jgi:hypothetical protein
MAQQGKGFGDTPPPPPGQPTPEDKYKPGFLARQVKELTDVDVYKPKFLRTKDEQRYHTTKVWSDIQGKLVSAAEYLRETEPVEMDFVDKVTAKAVDEAADYAKKKAKKAIGYDKPKDYVIKQTFNRAGAAGKFVGKAVGKVVGLDADTMGDATIDGARRRAQDQVREEYDQLAIHWKRSEVQAAVNGRSYEPNFLMGLNNVRKVTDAMQDFTPRREDSSFVYRPLFDTSQEQPDPLTPPSANEKKAKVSKMSKVTMNYDAKKAPTPIV